jgi:hypothetical protein
MKRYLTSLCVAGVLTATTAQADIFSSVPADTRYFMGNVNAYPEAVADFQIKKFATFGAKIMDQAAQKSKSGTGEHFMNVLFADYYHNLMAAGGMDNMGMFKTARYTWYGFDLMPVFRSEIADAAKLKAFINAAEKKSGFALKWKTCDGFDCATFSSDDSKQKFALVIQPKQVALAMFKPEDEAKYVAHLTGKTKVSSNIMDAGTLTALISDNGYTGHGEGFIKLKELLAEGRKLSDKKTDERCVNFAGRIIDHMPEIVMGSKKLETQRYQAEVVIKSSESLSGYFNSLADTRSKVARVDDPIAGIGLNLNMTKLRDALIDLITFIKKNGSETGCISDTKQLDEINAGVAMAMTFGLDKLNGLYVGLADIKVPEGKKKQQPPKFAASATVYAENTPMLLKILLSMAKMPVSQLDLNPDGKLKSLPKGMVPPVISYLKYRVFEDKLDVIGKNGMDDKEINYLAEDSSPSLFHLSLGQKLYGVIAEGMKDDGKKDEAEMMSLMKDAVPAFVQDMHADKRGLVFDLDMIWK